MLFRLCLRWAWMLIPMDWAFYATGSLEQAIFEGVRRAAIDMDKLQNRKMFERIDRLRSKGHAK